MRNLAPAIITILLVAAYGFGVFASKTMRDEAMAPRSVHSIAYCIPGGPWARPEALTFEPCRTDLVVDL